METPTQPLKLKSLGDGWGPACGVWELNGFRSEALLSDKWETTPALKPINKSKPPANRLQTEMGPSFEADNRNPCCFKQRASRHGQKPTTFLPMLFPSAETPSFAKVSQSNAQSECQIASLASSQPGPLQRHAPRFIAMALLVSSESSKARNPPKNKNRRGAPWDVVLALQSSESTANTRVSCMWRCWRLGETRVFACARHLVSASEHPSGQKTNNSRKPKKWEVFCHLVKKTKKLEKTKEYTKNKEPNIGEVFRPGSSPKSIVFFGFFGFLVFSSFCGFLSFLLASFALCVKGSLAPVSHVDVKTTCPFRSAALGSQNSLTLGVVFPCNSPSSPHFSSIP